MPEKNRLRKSANSKHAEANLYKAGDLLEAARQAAKLGTPDHPAQVMLVITKSPCDGEQTSCTNLLEKVWPETLKRLSDEERANIEPRLTVVVRGAYEGEEKGVATTTGSLRKLDQAGIDLQVMTVNGQMTPYGLSLDEALRSLFPTTALKQATLIKGLASSGATLRVASYPIAPPAVKAVAYSGDSVRPVRSFRTPGFGGRLAADAERV